MTAATPEQVAAAPKVALHEHLDGGLRPATVAEIAAEIGHELPADGADALGAWFAEASSSGSLERYLETFVHTVAVMQRPEDLARVARESVLDLATDGCVYAELRWAPEQHLSAGLTLRDTVDAVQAGIDEGRALAAEQGHPIVVGQLLTAMRHAKRGLEIAELVVEYRDRGVFGFDIAGAEDGFPPILHLEAFEYLRRENSHFTIHAGEGFGLPSIWQAIQRCGADRLGHGVRIVDDIDLTDPASPGARPAGRLRARLPHPAGDVPVVEPAHARRARHDVDRRPPDRHAQGARLPRHRQLRQPPDEQHVDEQGDEPAGRRVRLRPRRPALVHRQRHEERLPALRRAPRSDQHASSRPMRPCRPRAGRASRGGG